MLKILLLVFIIVPVVEFALILRVGGAIGFLETFVLIVVIGVAGAALWKREGMRTWTAFRDALAEGRWPGDEVAQGALVLFGGALLITPGFLTDIVGLLAVIPGSRAVMSRLVRRWVTPAPVREAFRFRDARRSRGTAGGDAARSPIDVEVVSVERDEPRRLEEEAPEDEREEGPGAAG